MLATASLSKAVVRLSGDLDIATREQTQARLDAIDSDVAIVDLTDVRFIDGGALGLFVALKKRLRARGRLGIVKIVTSNPRFVRLFHITGLVKLLDLHDSLPNARAA
ncbi:MAG TPA: STAS domain-containing protein [Candidatus Baltobacteraceae bacterium]|nr:STAS domain-containing protein [Candidatus Baltobacteraceae bacterium]